ncbi:MAG: hypothetical protein EAZ39_04720 [Oscillatoriales cyanobacterium]|nr:MAG: hypothetical protein EAZ39_04720 [Oscillatoriales cyanobacterium]
MVISFELHLAIIYQYASDLIVPEAKLCTTQIVQLLSGCAIAKKINPSAIDRRSILMLYSGLQIFLGLKLFTAQIDVEIC